MKHPLLFMVIIITAVMGARFPAAAQDDVVIEHGPPITELVEAQYISGILHPGLTGTGTKTEVPFVLKFALQDGWYMYWRTPGDSGLAPTFDWSTSENVKDVQIGWPAPQRFEQDGMYSFGYNGVVEIPVTVTINDMGKPLNFALDTSLIVCNKICVPQTLPIRATIAAGPSMGSPYDLYFEEIKGKLPLKDGGKKDDFYLDTAVLGKAAITFTLFSKDGFNGADLFIESDAVTITAPPSIEPDISNPKAAVFRVEAPKGTDALTTLLIGKSITVTAKKGDKSVEKTFSF